MKSERFPSDSGRSVLTLAAVFLIAGNTAALAQTSAIPADKSAPKSSTTTPHSAMDKKSSMMPGKPGMSPAGDMKGSMTGMMKAMESMKMSGDTDRDFAMMMKMHHQGAIDMAQMELQSGKDPKIRAMAKRIIDAQQKEIKEFDQWLGKQK